MKLGVVSDIHSNIEGLQAALAAMGPIDRLICLGDSIYDYRFSNEVVACLRDAEAIYIHGNHEQSFLSPLGERARNLPWVDQSLVQWMAQQPCQIDLNLAGRKLHLVHATPWSPIGPYVFPGDRRLQQFGEVDADFVLYGHTHSQLSQRIGGVHVVNPGSAGEARDSRNGLLLSCAVIDLLADSVTFHNFPDPTLAAFRPAAAQ